MNTASVVVPVGEHPPVEADGPLWLIFTFCSVSHVVSFPLNASEVEVHQKSMI